MMKRLRDQVSSTDPVVARAAALVAAMRPLDPSKIRRPPRPSEARARPGTLHLGLAFVVALILASAVAGAATLSGAGWVRSLASWGRPSRPSSSAPPVRAPIVGGTDANNASHLPAPAPADVLPIATATANSSASAMATPPVGAASRSVRSLAATAEESALVVDAVRALRRDHDARRAGELAEEVLQRYPHGVQREEAMAVAMEAAIADGDTAAARRWAERYLDSWRAGRFADRARDVLAAPPR
jgi:hypothetical protein